LCLSIYIVSNRIKEETNILPTVNRRQAKFIGHTLRRNCLLKCVIEGRIEGRVNVTGRKEKDWMNLMKNVDGGK